MNKRTDELKIANEIRVRYRSIDRELEVIKKSVAKILALCIELVPFISVIREANRHKMALWCKTNVPSVPYNRLKILESVGLRTSDGTTLMSWQSRMLGIVSPIHHRDKPISRTERKTKKKSWIHYVSKGHEGLVKQIEQMGGLNALGAEEKASIMAQFGSLGDVLIKLRNDK